MLSMTSVSAVESVCRSLHQSINNSHLLSYDPAIEGCPEQKNIHPISRLENLLCAQTVDNFRKHFTCPWEF